jgi:hypothetical protein
MEALQIRRNTTYTRRGSSSNISSSATRKLWIYI